MVNFALKKVPLWTNLLSWHDSTCNEKRQKLISGMDYINKDVGEHKYLLHIWVVNVMKNTKLTKEYWDE
jgi:hypothetical protein